MLRTTLHHLLRATTLPSRDELYLYSNPHTAQQKAFKYLGQNAVLYKSNETHKKYAIIHNGHIINFGQMGYADYTKTHDKIKRYDYLHRSAGIAGNWRTDPYSPNNLARHILW